MNEQADQTQVAVHFERVTAHNVLAVCDLSLTLSSA